MSKPHPATRYVEQPVSAWPLGSLYFTPVSGVITNTPSKEPMVAVYPTEYKNTYHLCVGVFIPLGSHPEMDPDFSDIETEDTQAGIITTRKFKIMYNKTSQSTHMLWILEVHYQVEGTQADAIRVYFSIGDPNTSRGTVTTVSNT